MLNITSVVVVVYFVSYTISGRLLPSPTTCCHGSLCPISHCLRPICPTSVFVSQHHGVLHLQHSAIHHSSFKLCQHLGFGVAMLSRDVQVWVLLELCWLSPLPCLSLSISLFLLVDLKLINLVVENFSHYFISLPPDNCWL